MSTARGPNVRDTLWYFALMVPALPFVLVGFVAGFAWYGLGWGYRCSVLLWEWVGEKVPPSG